MAKNKLFKYAEIQKMHHVYEATMDSIKDGKSEIKGKWREEIFQNDHPIVLELGCGRGEYTVGLAKKYPNKNFIGVDIKGNRIYFGAKEAMDNNLDNIYFLRSRIDFIDCFFDKDEVDEIWLTFSDPQPKKPRKRLTSKMFIDRYRNILKPGGIIHLKTDSDLLFEFTEEEIKEHGYETVFSSWDLYRDINQLDEDEREILSIKTFYEEMFSEKGSIIKYCKFKIN